MWSTLQILLPIFGLIAAGFVCRRRGIFSAAGASELNRFVVWLALPALLFDAMAHATWAQLYQPGFVLAFGMACALLFLAMLAQRLASGRPLADAAIDALAAAYPNTAYIGFPLMLIVFGQSGLLPATIATILVACVLFAVAIVLIEVGLQTERVPHRLGLKVLGSLARNPLIVSPILGALVAASGVHPADSIEHFLTLLGGAASPCALVSLGLFLAETRPASTTARGAPLLVLCKLVLQPLLTWWLAARLFHLPMATVNIAVLLAALPTGTGPFMLAEFYRREGQVTSRTILWATVGSLATLSVLMVGMRAS